MSGISLPMQVDCGLAGHSWKVERQSKLPSFIAFDQPTDWPHSAIAIPQAADMASQKLWVTDGTAPARCDAVACDLSSSAWRDGPFAVDIEASCRTEMALAYGGSSDSCAGLLAHAASGGLLQCQSVRTW